MSFGEDAIRQNTTRGRRRALGRTPYGKMLRRDKLAGGWREGAERMRRRELSRRVVPSECFLLCEAELYRLFGLLKCDLNCKKLMSDLSIL
jgi:hypothetical protein